jgi:hypothetical protein
MPTVQNIGTEVPGLIKTVETLDPELAAEGKSALESKTLGAMAAIAVGWAVAHWGFNWDADTVNAVAGLLALGAATGLRLITTTPITSVLPVKK